MAKGEGTVGNEIPKEYREVVRELVANQGWRYNTGKGHPKLYPPDPTMPIVTVPTTPSDGSRGFRNFVGQVRRSGGVWPVTRR